MSPRTMRGTLVLATSAVLAACNDSTGPRYAEFDPERAQANADAMMAVFESAAVEQFMVASWHINMAGASSLAAVTGARRLIGTRGRPTALEQRAHVVALKEALFGPANVAAMAVLPDDVRGRTFVYDQVEGSYVQSDRAGAPANGVRFVLYAVEEGGLSETEVGYMELLDLAPAGEGNFGVRLRVVSAGTTYLDYNVGIATTQTSLALDVAGYVTNGTTRVNYQTRYGIQEGPGGYAGSITFGFDVPSRSFSVEGAIRESEESAEIEIVITSNRAEVRYHFANGEMLTGLIYVNGALFAQITEVENGYDVVGANGRSLTVQEREVLLNLLQMAEGAFFWWFLLLLPVGGFVPL